MSYGRNYKCDNRDLMEQIADAFLAEKLGRKKIWGNFRIEQQDNGNRRLFYRTKTKCEERFRSGWNDSEEERAEKRKKALKKLSDGLKSGLYTLDNGAEYKDIKNSDYIEYFEREENTIAVQIQRDGETITLGNSAILDLIGQYSSYGNKQSNRDQTVIQQVLVDKQTPMIPFSIFDQANLNIMNINILDQSGDETVTREVENPNYNEYNKKEMEKRGIKPKFEETVHYTGASLFEIDGRYFLFDIDREEIKHKIFNPFVVELTQPVKSIEGAYESLRPKEVVTAEAEGLEVIRQGEWFFIPDNTFMPPQLNDQERILALASQARLWGPQETILGKGFCKKIQAQGQTHFDKLARPLELRAGPNRPNNVELGLQRDNVTYCTGLITHSGREHRDLLLDGWYRAVPNTSVGSFTITGDVD